jgi:hypothetical protein
VGGLGVRLTTLLCKKKFVEKLLKILEEAEAHIWAVVPLLMMMISTSQLQYKN